MEKSISPLFRGPRGDVVASDCPYGKAVFVRKSDEYAVNILQTALFTVIIHSLLPIPIKQSWSDKKVIAECLQLVI